MNKKRKRGDASGYFVAVLWLLTLLFFAWICVNSTYYQFDGVAPCTPESSICITEYAK